MGFWPLCGMLPSRMMASQMLLAPRSSILLIILSPTTLSPLDVSDPRSSTI
jgi:hypothetical protein